MTIYNNNKKILKTEALDNFNPCADWLCKKIKINEAECKSYIAITEGNIEEAKLLWFKHKEANNGWASGTCYREEQARIVNTPTVSRAPTSTTMPTKTPSISRAPMSTLIPTKASSISRAPMSTLVPTRASVTTPTTQPSVEEIGKSVENRPILAYKLGSGKNIVLGIGGLHTGVENVTSDLALMVNTYFQDNPSLIPNNVTLYVIPVANPDGYAKNMHTNANLVDLNRNWCSANWASATTHIDVPVSGGSVCNSEPETKALSQFIISKDVKIIFVWHSRGAMVEDNATAKKNKLGTLFSTTVGYEYVPKWVLYPITGQLIDYAEEKLKKAAFDVELNSTSINDPNFSTDLENNKRAVKELLDITNNAF